MRVGDAKLFARERCVVRVASAEAPQIELVPLDGTEAHLFAGLARIDPWARLGFDRAGFAKVLSVHDAGLHRYKIVCGEADAGLLVIRFPWLYGPYLNLIGIFPEFQGTGIGTAVLAWLETEALLAGGKNVWLCVSAFNHGALRFYERLGYERAAHLSDLVIDGEDEILMRKRLRSENL